MHTQWGLIFQNQKFMYRNLENVIYFTCNNLHVSKVLHITHVNLKQFYFTNCIKQAFTPKKDNH